MVFEHRRLAPAAQKPLVFTALGVESIV